MLSQTVDEKMRKVISYFSDNNFEVGEVITKGRKQGLTEKQILSGMARVYERMEQGENIKPIRMAWAAWQEAKTAKNNDVKKFLLNRDLIIKENKKLEKRVAVIFVVSLFTLLASWLGFFMYLEYFL